MRHLASSNDISTLYDYNEHGPRSLIVFLLYAITSIDMVMRHLQNLSQEHGKQTMRNHHIKTAQVRYCDQKAIKIGATIEAHIPAEKPMALSNQNMVQFTVRRAPTLLPHHPVIP